MKLTKEQYKKYPLPIGWLLVYLISCAASIILLGLAGYYIVMMDTGLWILDGVVKAALIIIAYVLIVRVGLFITGIFLDVFEFKIYRGKGTYLFVNIIIALCPLAFVGVVYLFNILHITYTFYDFITLLGQCSFPVILGCFGRLKKCRSCGLLNTHTAVGGKDEHVSTRVEYYDYYSKAQFYETRKSQTTTQCSVCGSYDSTSSEYEKQV